MRFQKVRQRLRALPAQLPAPPAELRPRVILRTQSVPAVAADPAVAAVPTVARRAAALVLLYADAVGQTRLVLTERPTGSLRHSGEISLPGGAANDDESDVDAALREAAEEVGLDVAAAGVEVAGVLDPVEIAVSGFRLVPVVAVAQRRPQLRADAREVASVVEAPLAAFLPGAPIEIVEEERRGRLMRYGAYRIGGFRVWGATAAVLGQLGAILGDERAARSE